MLNTMLLEVANNANQAKATPTVLFYNLYGIPIMVHYARNIIGDNNFVISFWFKTNMVQLSHL